jgi:glycosyltransferase involved in cell wall biosynthesis
MRQARSRATFRPKLGIVAHAPIQYHTPLFQLLAKRNNVDLDVLFLSDRGVTATLDQGFGLAVAWDIDLLSGYTHSFLTIHRNPVSIIKRVRMLVGWVPLHDAVVVNGYTIPWVLLTMAICRMRGIPYLLRGSSHPQGESNGVRRYLRWAVTRLVVAGSSGALSMGRLNDDFYRQAHARSVTFAPNSVDDARFRNTPPIDRSELLAKWGLKADKPVILFCGKLMPLKRPLDIIAAVKRLSQEVSILFVGDGLLAERVQASLTSISGAVTGFVNQSDLPNYYHAADILVLPSEWETWGLVVNEAMAAGTLPVVSDRVGCGPDLVNGVGEIYPCGDIASLAAALGRALERIKEPDIRDCVRQHVAPYGLVYTAIGFEQATLSAAHRARPVGCPDVS